MTDRNEATKRIKKGLKARTGRTWSVSGNSGTAWGWITIQAPKGRRVVNHVNPERQPEEGKTGWYTSQEDREILAEALGIGMNEASFQGVSISPDSREWYVDRAENGPPTPELEPIYEPEPIEFQPLPEVVVNEDQIEDFGEHAMVAVKVPFGNKRSHLAEYLTQLDNEDDYRIEQCQVERIVTLTDQQYDNLVNGNLLTGFDWLAGRGGCESTADLRDVDNFEDYSEDEQVEYQKGAYIIAVKVTAPDRPVIYIDPQGYSYARYVAFPVEEEIPTADEANSMFALAEALLESYDPGKTLNILIGGGLEAVEAMATLTEVMSTKM